MADYLLWAADLVSAQQATAEAAPLPEAEARSLANALRQPHAPLHTSHWQRSAHWLEILSGLLKRLEFEASMQSYQLRQVISFLREADSKLLNRWATTLLATLRGDSIVEPDELPDPGSAQLLYSALSLYWRQLASQLPGSGMAELGAHRHDCPVCGQAPTGSLVLGGTQAGLRYLQCSLCESQWHVVRTTRTSCDAAGKLDYWCLEDEKAPIKAESCGDCHSYLKAFYLQADHQLELVADDLASLALDAEMEAQELVRSGINPLMLPPLVEPEAA